jgi:hypothetical protein
MAQLFPIILGTSGYSGYSGSGGGLGGTSGYSGYSGQNIPSGTYVPLAGGSAVGQAMTGNLYIGGNTIYQISGIDNAGSNIAVNGELQLNGNDVFAQAAYINMQGGAFYMGDESGLTNGATFYLNGGNIDVTTVGNGSINGIPATYIMNYTGAWSSSTAYIANEVVTVGGVSYICILSHTNHTPPNATYWVALGGGTSGYSGYSGISGFSGYSGYSGKSGYSGYSGVGTSGYSGYSGANGTNGATGTSGYSGYSGISGYSGYSGATGSTGSAGTSGYSGYSGISGYSGYSGKSGWSGYSGAVPSNSIIGMQFLVSGTGYVGGLQIPCNCTIQNWTIISTDNVSGSIQIDLQTASFANYQFTSNTGNTIVGSSALCKMTSAVTAQSSTLTGWTTALTGGNYLFVVITSYTSVDNVRIEIQVLP